MATVDHVGQGHVWHGVTWATGRPTLLLANPATGHLEQRDIVDQRIGLKVLDGARYCTGRYAFRDTYQVEPLPCPGGAEAADGGQCATCAAQDDFRFAHRYHQTGRGSAALRAYMAQPHWLYVATFGPGLTKVGTAAGPRKESRLNEQGPICATYLVEAADGRSVRHLEDGLSRDLDVPQTVRASAKLAALTRPDPRQIRGAHEEVVVAATAALARSGHSPTRMDWSPPPEGTAIRSPHQQQRHVVYPHPLGTGKHGFHVEACHGTVALVRLSPTEDVRYVLDLNVLKGTRVLLGSFTSPTTATQTALF